MNETQILQEIRRDQQQAMGGKVLYLEGKTDVPIFYALLGRDAPPLGLARTERILVRGLRDQSGSGGSAVRMRVDLAQRSGLSGIYGVLDGDGADLASLAASFDAPFAGPLFAWKAYCIENLLAKVGWPDALGDPPDWPEALARYAPYVALNRLHRTLIGALETLRLHRFVRPNDAEPLLTVDDVAAALDRDKHLVASIDVGLGFRREAERYLDAVRQNLDDAHALLNGKWLLTHLAPAHARRRPDQCLDAWIRHAIAAGGLAEASSLWSRIAQA